MRRPVALLLVILLVLPEVALAVSGKQVRYAGGTIADIAQNATGSLDLTDQAALFTTKDGKAKIVMPYANIESLEYGQKAGRRVGAAVVVSPLFLFSKTRKHFLTIAFTDEQGQKQGVVFELSKGIVNQTLSTLETRTGKKVEDESDEARKYAEKH
jgi:autotransporter adhesin